MTDKFHEVERFPGQVDRIPSENAERVAALTLLRATRPAN